MNQAPNQVNGTAKDPGEDDEKPRKESDDKILKRIQKRRDLAFEAWKDDRVRQLDDLKFCDQDNQWPEAERMKRKAEGRPCLVLDRTNPFIDQLVNEERQNRPAIAVHPIDDGADEFTADVLKGYFRHVEITSNADFAYDRASESQKRCGFGFVRVMTDYISDDSMDQDVKIVSVPNPFMWFIDPSSTEPDGSDMDWAFGEEDLTDEQFKDQFPNADLSSASDSEWKSIGTSVPGWISDGGHSARVLEYYEKVRTPYTLCLLQDGRTVDKKKLVNGDVVKRERLTNRTSIMWYKVCANEILERGDVAGGFIPIVPVYGKELIVDGERQYWGIVRPMRPVQQMVNVGNSSLTETIAMAPKAPYMVDVESIEGYEGTWASANTKNHAYLPFKSWANNRQLPMPSRQVAEPAIQAIALATHSWEEDLKAVTGMYDPSRGKSEADQSGAAIGKLQQQAQTGNFHFTDNMNRAIRQVGRIVLGMMQEVVDAERLLHIVGVDGKPKQESVNTSEPVKDPKTGLDHVYDVTVGKYDVTISAGPSYQTKRQETVVNLMNLAKVSPRVEQLGADIIIRNMDFPENDEMADRLTPPQFKKQEDGQPPIPPEVQKQMQGMAQLNDALTKRVHELTDVVEAKKLELESKERIALINASASLGVQELKNNMGALSEEIAHIHEQWNQDFAHRELAANTAVAMMPPPQPAGQEAGGQPAAPEAAQPSAPAPDAGQGAE